MILKQDKGRDIVILDITKYTEKCMALLNTERFKRLTTDPTAATERKIQKVSRKIKSKFSEQEYKRLYPTGSTRARFYGTAKIHKLKTIAQLMIYQYDLLSPTLTQHHTNLQNI